ncbi:DUF3048 domain-containing protein [Fredinandcohnia quinoae]|uniref:DUF3048 domain-containing protein n=1 Tax=Fredinandcohnia quinoae TaxID=2918902 RepID=A0AAW5E5L2_9BACI|nr:DUF3048 domain-containing protein [Fredinandcohnia sp. SECRCQ15]MCH1624671.1 DUF3048 domain-containing protein [Fredinandcohnia sp. SECRCQ15]
MKKYLIVLAIFLLLFSTACSKKEEATKDEQEPEQVENVEKDEPRFTNMYPLTGIGTDEQVMDRPVAVMINNHPKARPQSGLHMADIVYEVLAEGDLTRFLAIYQSEKPEIIGPVRSSRDYFIELSSGFDALYIAHGWSPEAKEILQSGAVDNLNGMEYDGSLFWRADFRVAPHNSYISYENIIKGAEKEGYHMIKEAPSFKFLSEDETKGIEGTTAEHVRISYSSRDSFAAVYDFNQEVGKYERYSGGEQTVDRETNTPILIDNVLIVEMNHHFIDDYGRREVELTSGGKGYLLQNGKANEVEWQNVDGRIVPFIDGREVGLIPGKTWINIIPTSPGIAGAVSFGN